MTTFDWPWEYSFPPFFTIQRHESTREEQLRKWTDLVIRYQKNQNGLVLNISTNSPLFDNSTINRKLGREGRLLVLEKLQKSGHAIPLDKSKNSWEVYWHTIDEWANIIYNWVIDNGKANTVCTLYEISNGDDSETEEFHKLDVNVITKALKCLEEQGKCELLSFDGHEGVKFY